MKKMKAAAFRSLVKKYIDARRVLPTKSVYTSAEANLIQAADTRREILRLQVWIACYSETKTERVQFADGIAKARARIRDERRNLRALKVGA